MDWFLYDNNLHHERVKDEVPLKINFVISDMKVCIL